MSETASTERIVLVTGASRGIGRACALTLAARGAHVIGLARTQGGLEALDDEIAARGAKATLVPCDLADFDAIDRLGAVIYERWGRLDGLVANAALLGVLSPVGHIDPKVWNDAVAVNLTANYRLIRSMDPLLRQSEAGRAVFVSSAAAEKRRAFWGVYAATKAALEAMVYAYAAETEKSALCVNLFNPGPTATAMRAKAFPGEDPDTLPSADDVGAALADMVAADYSAHGVRVNYPDLVSASSA